ncbi:MULTISPECIES: ParD-like family protein [unclassified Pseudomonas]|uniref:ParD-like family protein n=1 Tax=unclassified Pseudomonas TaxID=196821 RepID=UPI000A1E3A6A|nr:MULTISPECIES: ParD-like family protein [unclassified Pseudomonas]
MGIVKISEDMHENLRISSNALSRSINAQAEHWMRIGMLAELYPDLDHHAICRLLIRAEQSGGLDLQQVCALADAAQNASVKEAAKV